MKHLRVLINKVEDDSPFVSGIVGSGSYKFYAKITDEPSEQYGINGGRIIKLVITTGDINDTENIWGGVVVNYDRGWDIQPGDSRVMEIFHSVIDELEKLPIYKERIYKGSKINKIIAKTKRTLTSEA